jgi:poly-gamma-glutamate synthesis protein (capsule biosynthesis protein)
MIDHKFFPHRAPCKDAFRFISRADLVFTNLEIPLGTVGYPREKMFAFRCDPSVTETLLDAGIDVVSLANNHMLDYGEQVLLETVETLTNAGITYVGAGANLDQACKPAIREAGGVRMAFLGLAATLPLSSAASETRPGIAPVHVSTSYEIDPTLLQEQPGNPPRIRTVVDPRDEKRICKLIRAVRAKADHVVVGIHWGVAFTKKPEEYQQPLGRKMIEAGATLIVGHHSHVRQGVEHHEGGTILYSLGDFVFHDRVDMTGESGMIAAVEFEKKSIGCILLHPVTVDSKSGLPILGGKKEASQLLEEMRMFTPTGGFTLEGNAVIAHPE